MLIKQQKLTLEKLKPHERIQYDIISKEIIRIRSCKEFKEKIAIQIITTDQNSSIQIFSFSSSTLTEFTLKLMIALRNVKFNLKYENKNIQQPWSPTWATTIILDNGR